jgi:hypothetical protein
MIGISSQHQTIGHSLALSPSSFFAFVGAAEGCDLLILVFGASEDAEDQKIAAFGSSYGDIARGMPEQLSNNEYGKKQAGVTVRLLFACPFQGNKHPRAT